MVEDDILGKMQNAIFHAKNQGLVPERFEVSEDAYDQLVNELLRFSVSPPSDVSTDQIPKIFGIKVVVNPHYPGKTFSLVSGYKNIT